MRRILFSLLLAIIVGSFAAAPVFAQTSKRATPTPVIATTSATASLSAETATPAATAVSTPAAQLQQFLEQQQNKDITENTGKTQNKLIQILEENPTGPLYWHNFLQKAIRRAVDRGLSPNLVVLILLFPFITSIIAFARHIIGLKGFGVYTPAVLAVAFVSTGIFNGILLFVVILAAAILMRRLLKRLNLQYLPRTAMLLWGVSIFTLVAFLIFAYIPFTFLLTINIFPLLIVILLTENFMETQLSSSQSEATQLTIETLLLAIFCSVLISLDVVQRYVILQPELYLLLVGAFNIFIGRYSGLRLMEWLRFRSIID